MPVERIQYEKLTKGEPLYISPIIYENLRKNKLNGYTHDEVKSDAFSLGLVILEAALQKSVQKIYG
jgi:hypothetical protein